MYYYCLQGGCSILVLEYSRWSTVLEYCSIWHIVGRYSTDVGVLEDTKYGTSTTVPGVVTPALNAPTFFTISVFMRTTHWHAWIVDRTLLYSPELRVRFNSATHILVSEYNEKYATISSGDTDGFSK